MLKVLLVEDEFLIALDMEDMLRAMGFAVIGPAMRLQKALTMARHESFDLAVLDVNLAGERSFPVAGVLRERGIPFLFVTGYGAAGLTDEFAGTITVQKPVELRQLKAAIQAARTPRAGMMFSRADLDTRLRKLSELASTGYFIGLHIRSAAPLIQFQTYPVAWTEHYFQSGYALRDPTIAWGFSTTGACRWTEHGVFVSSDIMKEAAAHGLRFGLTTSHGPISSRTIASFARADRDFTQDEVAMIGELVQQLHELTEPPTASCRAYET